MQIRAPKQNEAVIVKQLADRFNGTMKSMASQGEGRARHRNRKRNINLI